MKSTIFREVINEELIEVNKSALETIQYLREQSIVSHISKPDNIRVYFKCSKKGKISVVSGFGPHRDLSGFCYIYYVYGSVISKDNKTYVKITSVYKKSDIWLRSLLLVLLILIAPILLLLKTYIEVTFFVPALIASFIVFFIGIIDFIKTTSFRKRDGLVIVTLMENEIKKRVQNIEHWDN